MDSIYILVPIALLFTAVAIKAFLWAVDNKQYDDLDAAAHSILFDDDDSKDSSRALNQGGEDQKKASTVKRID